MKKTIILMFAMGLFFMTRAQDKPQPSPASSSSTVVGLTTIKIDYFRPKMNNRKIYGDGSGFLVPYGKLWRTGANSGTKITFSTDVTVEGTKVPKGEYLIFSWPGASEWTVSLYKDISIGGYTNKYDKANEVANFKVKSGKLTEKVEMFTVGVSDVSEDSTKANIQISWENTSVKIGVTVPKTW